MLLELLHRVESRNNEGFGVATNMQWLAPGLLLIKRGIERRTLLQRKWDRFKADV